MRLVDARVQARVVGRQPRDGDGAFARGEPPCCGRVGGGEEGEEEGPGDGEGAEDYEGELLRVGGAWLVGGWVGGGRGGGEGRRRRTFQAGSALSM